MAGGYMGKILNVDLSAEEIEEEALDGELCREYIGGYGLAARLLYDRIPVGADPLGPDNILGFMTGPLTGTPAIIGSRYVVVGKSPLSNTWGDCNSGGDFGPYLKFAGFDGVFFSGISERPVYLFVHEGKAELRDAGHLWGKDTHQTEDILREELGKDIRVVSIGPSGEKLSLIACPINDRGRAPGRSGMGAVMGSKRLKAIAVKGKLKVPVANPGWTRSLRRKYLVDLREGHELNGAYENLHDYGTSGITAASAMSGDSPVRNWTGVGVVDFRSASAISDEVVVHYQERRYGCWQCPIRCGGTMVLDKGKFALLESESYRGHKPEYETLCMFGTNLLNDDVESIIKLNEICNRYGLDTISAGAAIALAIECYERGILTKEDTDGLEMTWGNAEAIVAMTEKLGKREGLGDILADGAQRAAAKIGKGAEEYAVHVQGQEVPAHDPKYMPGLALTYLLDATPGRHTQGGELIKPPDWDDIPDYDKYEYSGKAEIYHKLISTTHVVNAAGLCLFGYISMDVHHLPEFLSAVTDWEYTLEDLFEVGDRIATIRHAFNLREGHNPLLRPMSGRIVGEPPLTAGPIKGITVDYKTEVREYLELMGWDGASTIPGEEALKALGMDFLLEERAKWQVPPASW